MDQERVRYRLTRRHRLHLQADFDRLFRRRCVVSDGPMVIYVDDAGLPIPRLGLRVGKRAGGAVERGRLKRCVREAFRLCQHEIPRCDYLVVIRQGGVDAATIRRLFGRLSQDAARRLARQRKPIPPKE